MLSPKRVIGKFKAHHDFMWDYSIHFFITLFRPAMVFLVFMGFVVITAFAYAFFYFEGGGVNPQVTGIFDALYFSVSTITTVGFGDIAPVTRAGRMLAMSMMIIGTGLFVAFTAIISSTIIHIEQARFMNKNEPK